MPAQLSFFDMAASVTPPEGYFPPFPVPLGPNWQPGDIRVYCQHWFAASTDTTWVQPPGFSTTNAQGQQGGASGTSTWWRYGVSWRRLVAGDVDTFYTFNTVPALWWHTVMFTVRGVDPGSSPAITTFQFNGPLGSIQLPPASVVVNSVSVPSAGTTAIWIASHAYIATTGATGNGVGMAAPSGWQNLVASSNSGATYNPYDISNGTIAVAKSFSSSGSTGSVTFPISNSTSSMFNGATMFFKPAPDVSFTATSPPSTVAAATNATLSTSTAVTVTAGSASTTATASTAFNPVQGYWVSDPLTLPGDPVTGSAIRWVASTPTGTTAVIETSINNGASWDLATNNRPIPRLRAGDTATRGIIARVTMTRTLATDTPPRVSQLELQVSVDSGIDELVPVGHGMIDKVTVKAVGGSTGGGSSTGVAGSSGVTSKGGGQTGGGTSIKVHVTDLSRAIKRNQWQMPYVVQGGTNYGDAVVAMVQDRLPSQTDFSIASTARLTPLLVYGLDQGGDPWQDIQELAIAIGFEAFFDPRGVFVFRPVPDPRVGEPVWVFDEDSNPTVVEASRQLSDEQTFNDVVVTGQSTSSQNPVTAEAFDNDPSSPTYILGRYGRVTQRVTFSQITDQDQAQDAADATLFNSLGAADTVTITCVPMPALEPGDVVKINVSNVKADGTYMINSMTTPLSPAEPQQLVCFRQSTNT
jgi:hypothetical protein